MKKKKTTFEAEKNYIKFALIFKTILSSGRQNSNVDMVLFFKFFSGR